MFNIIHYPLLFELLLTNTNTMYKEIILLQYKCDKTGHMNSGSLGIDLDASFIR